jgi:hypothetical protein
VLHEDINGLIAVVGDQGRGRGRGRGGRGRSGSGTRRRRSLPFKHEKEEGDLIKDVENVHG